MTAIVSQGERSDYPEMVTPTELRNLAEGLENSNSSAEYTARLYYYAAELFRSCEALVQWAEEPGEGVLGQAKEQEALERAHRVIQNVTGYMVDVRRERAGSRPDYAAQPCWRP